MEKANLKKSTLILIYNNQNDLYYSVGEGVVGSSLEDFASKLKDLSSKVRKVELFITDNNIFIENFDINISNMRDAREAAYNMLLLNNVDNKSSITYKKVILKREQKALFKATVFYTYTDLSPLIEILKQEKLDKKIVLIAPLMEIFINRGNFCYHLNDKYYTIIEDIHNIAIFQTVIDQAILDKYIKEDLSVEEVFPKIIQHGDKIKLNFIDSGKYDFVAVIFVPAIIFIILLNISIYTVLLFQKSSLKKKFNISKDQVSQELKELEPFQKADEQNSKIIKVIDEINKFRKSSFDFNRLVEILSSDKKVSIRQISLNNDNLIIEGKADSASTILDNMKKLEFLKEVQINNKIVREPNGFEKFSIKAKFVDGIR